MILELVLFGYETTAVELVVGARPGVGQGSSSWRPCPPCAGASNGWSSWGRGLSLLHPSLPGARAYGVLIRVARRTGRSGVAHGEGAPSSMVCGERASVGAVHGKVLARCVGEGICDSGDAVQPRRKIFLLYIKEKRMVRD